MVDYTSLADIAKRFEDEFDDLKSNKLKFVKSAKTDLKKFWPAVEKIRYLSKYRSYTDTEWLINGKQEAIVLANIDRSEQPEEDGLYGTIFKRDLIFIEDAFFKLDFRIDWDKRRGGSNKESFTTHELTEERLLKVLADDRVFKSFVNTITRIKKKYSK
ncbi:MAG: hypothetical protein K0B02_04300 [DPANN group archaeon]|nr:hypothetical protein [DPANN group archaeon]